MCKSPVGGPLITGALIGEPGGVCFPGLLRVREKYIWVPYLDPESRGTEGLLLRPRCIGLGECPYPHFCSILFYAGTY